MFHIFKIIVEIVSTNIRRFLISNNEISGISSMFKIKSYVKHNKVNLFYTLEDKYFKSKRTHKSYNIHYVLSETNL